MADNKFLIYKNKEGAYLNQAVAASSRNYKTADVNVMRFPYDEPVRMHGSFKKNPAYRRKYMNSRYSKIGIGSVYADLPYSDSVKITFKRSRFLQNISM